MRRMGEEPRDSDVAEPQPLVRPSPRRGAARRTHRNGRGSRWLLALLALCVAGFASWRIVMLEHGQGDAASALRAATLGAASTTLERSGRPAQARSRSLRARLADTDTVNKGVREELLALGERSRHLEDAVANLAEQRLTGRDALALNEAEFLLQLAQERLDAVPRCAGRARRLPARRFGARRRRGSGVRRRAPDDQRRNAGARSERSPLDTNATLGALERVRANLATLPPSSRPRRRRRRRRAASTCLPSSCASATRRGCAERPRRRAQPRAGRDRLRAAEAALLARDADGLTARSARARAAIAALRRQRAAGQRTSGRARSPRLPRRSRRRSRNSATRSGNCAICA